MANLLTKNYASWRTRERPLPVPHPPPPDRVEVDPGEDPSGAPREALADQLVAAVRAGGEHSSDRYLSAPFEAEHSDTPAAAYYMLCEANAVAARGEPC